MLSGGAQIRKMVPRTIRHTIFQGCSLTIQRRPDGGGWDVVIIDPADNHEYRCPFNEDNRQDLLRQLTGGITLPTVHVEENGKPDDA